MELVKVLAIVAVVLIMLLLAAHVLANLYNKQQTTDNRKWVGVGAPVGAFVLRSDRLQSPSTNPFYSQFATLAAGTALATAFPPLVGSAFSARPSPLLSSSGAPLWIIDSDGLSSFVNAYYVGQPRPTPAAAQSKLQQLTADPANASQMFSLVLAAFSAGKLTFARS